MRIIRSAATTMPGLAIGLVLLGGPMAAAGPTTRSMGDDGGSGPMLWPWSDGTTADGDGDRLTDAFEARWGITDPLDEDSDGDGLPDVVEIELGLDPTKVDTDDDGTGDGDEDTDHDKLTDRFEVRESRTDPGNPDSDNDGIRDSIEDADGDGLSARGEQRFTTDPHDRDTDDDGRSDWDGDANHDGIPNGMVQDDRPVPQGLIPSLRLAGRDLSWIGTQKCHSRPGETRPVRCNFRFGPDDRRKVVLLIGDSHAVHWFNALLPIAERKGWKLVTMTKSSCPIADVVNYRKGKVALDCGVWRRRAFRQVRQLHPDLVIASTLDSYLMRSPVTGRPTTNPDYWKAGMIRSLKALRAGAKHVVLLGDVFEWGEGGIACLKARTNHVSACQRRRHGPESKRGQRKDRIGREAAAAAGVQFRAMRSISCTYDPCPLIVELVLVTRDGGHLTTTYASFLSRALEKILPKP